MTYDLCVEAWPAAFNQQVRDYLYEYVNRAFHDHGSFTEYTGWRLGHKLGTDIVARACIVALVLQGEPGPAPQAPWLYLVTTPSRLLPQWKMIMLRFRLLI